MTKVVLHVGTHKTGTTSIQAALAASRPALIKAGILYPDVSPFFGGRRDAQHELAHALARDDSANKATLIRFITYLREVAPRFDTILISAEPFYRHALGTQEYMGTGPKTPRIAREAYLDRLARLFEGFESEIAIYFRNPLAFAESLFVDSVVNSPSTLDFDAFIERRAISFDYRFQLDSLRARFGQVAVMSYEDKAAEGLVGSFFHDFCRNVAPSDLPRLRTSVGKGAVAWLLGEKQIREMSIREIRERWHFALQPEHDRLFALPEPVTFWRNNVAREEFFHRTADAFSELAFAPPEPIPETLFWAEHNHRAAEDAWYAWSKTNGAYLSARHRLSLPAYVQSPKPSVVVGLSDGQIIAETRKGKILKTAVCVITRKRPRMIKNLLDSFRSLDVPPHVELFFVVMENSDRLELIEQIAAFRAMATAHSVYHEIEPELGIPLARNKAVQTALLNGASVVLFVDDDEVVTKDWLCRIITRYRESDLMLIGGPVAVNFEGQPRSSWGAGLRRGIIHRYNNKIRKSGALWRKGKESRITVVTNNWLADAQLFTKYRLRFDERLRFSGGSDSEFHHRVHDRGIPTGWALDAMVIETIPETRISLRYQFRRAMAQSRNSLGEHYRRKGIFRATAMVAAVLPLRALGVCFTIIGLPLTRGKGLIVLARSTGWIVGRITGLFGAKSKLYSNIMGH